jgi:hypothetical protein
VSNCLLNSIGLKRKECDISFICVDMMLVLAQLSSTAPHSSATPLYICSLIYMYMMYMYSIPALIYMYMIYMYIIPALLPFICTPSYIYIYIIYVYTYVCVCVCVCIYTCTAFLSYSPLYPIYIYVYIYIL